MRLHLLNKQLSARLIIVKYWKSSRRYRFYLSFQQLFQQLAYFVQLNKQQEENDFQERMNSRNEIEKVIASNLLKKKEFYQQQLFQRRKKILKITDDNDERLQHFQMKSKSFNETSTSSSPLTSLTLFEPHLILADEHLLPWCDEDNEYFNSFYNMKEYRKWLQRYAIQIPK